MVASCKWISETDAAAEGCHINKTHEFALEEAKV